MKHFKSIHLVILLFAVLACQNNQNLPKVKEVDLTQIDLSDFTEEEWFVPYYLKHFAEVANSVVDTGENRNLSCGEAAKITILTMPGLWKVF